MVQRYTQTNSGIDNNIAERSIRPLTPQRNSMLHFGNDEGAEMAAAYHSVISTVKMHDRLAWEFLSKFFTKSLIKRIASSLLERLSVKTLSKIFNGCRDFVNLLPDKIGNMPIVNKHIEFLTTQIVGTRKSAYSKGVCPNLSTNS